MTGEEGEAEVAEEIDARLVEAHAIFGEIVRPDDGRITPCATGADVTLFQNRNIRDAVLRGQVIRRGKAVSAATNDDDIIRVRQALGPMEHPGLRIRLAEPKLQ